jgi:hypothetical protein
MGAPLGSSSDEFSFTHFDDRQGANDNDNDNDIMNFSSAL